MEERYDSSPQSSFETQRSTYRGAVKDQSAVRFDGNISEITAVHGTLSNDTYAYSYDGMKRLLGADRYIGSSSSSSLTRTEGSMVYDRNGNITALKRYGNTGLDNDLSFTLTGNKMTGLSDAGTPGGSFTYSYDAMGNMTSDGRQGLLFSYNILNLPCGVTDVSNVTSGSLTYTYLSDGTKVSAVREDGSGKRYVGSMVYSVPASGGGSETLESAVWDEGRIGFTKSGSTYTLTDLWFVKDHLGNVRSVVDVSPGLSSPQVVERNDYLPYGTRLSVGNAVLATNRYRLACKEEQVFGSLDLGKVDFGARQYDPFTARWTTHDPMAEKYASLSPYSYCADNSVNYIDSQGDTLVVLLAPEGAAGFGHMAILIQHEDNKYYLYSKNGDKDWGIWTSFAGNGDKSNDIGKLSWDSPEAFISDGGHMFNYTEALIIPTTPTKDAAAKEQATESISSTYNLFFSNCAQAVIQILDKAGIPTEPNYNPSSEMPVFRTIPRLVYPQIKMVNPNSRVIKKRD